MYVPHLQLYNEGRVLRLLGYFLKALISVAWRRARGAGLRSDWSFSFETLVAAMRSYAAWLGTLAPATLRIAAARLTNKAAVVARAATLNGVNVTRSAPTRSKRVVVYLHGGGYVLGSPAQDAALIGRLSILAEAEVVAPDYRLAPEARCPCAIDDAIATYRALLSEGLRPDDVSIVGLSSGGGLALAATQRMSEEGLPAPRSVVLLSPMLDCTASRESWTRNAPFDWADRDVVVQWARAYAGDLPLTDSRLSPINGNLTSLPPVLVITGELELGHDDAVALIDKMKAVGSRAQLHVGRSMVHAFVTLNESTAEVGKALDVVRQFLSEATTA